MFRWARFKPASPPDVFSYLVWSQISLFGSLVLCVALIPRFLFSRNMGGVSNYGVQPRTVAVYTLGVVAAALLLLRAARASDRRASHRLLAGACRLIAVLYLGNLLTTYPYKLSPGLALVHSWAAILLALTEVAVGLVLAVRVARSAVGYGALAVQLVGFLLLVLTYVGATHVLFVAETTTAAAFGALLLASARAAATTG